MSNKLEISIPQSVVWLLRLAVNPTLSRTLQKDPVAFAAWYAAVGSLYSGRASAGHARQVLEGYAVHDWMHRNPQEFTALAASTLAMRGRLISRRV